MMQQDSPCQLLTRCLYHALDHELNKLSSLWHSVTTTENRLSHKFSERNSQIISVPKFLLGFLPQHTSCQLFNDISSELISLIHLFKI
jgi:hypothetical protein